MLSTDPYYTCSNIGVDKHIHGAENFKPCSNEICCENYVCKAQQTEGLCLTGKFKPNAQCNPITLNPKEDCNISNCCDNGIPYVRKFPDSLIQKEFHSIVEQIITQISK